MKKEKNISQLVDKSLFMLVSISNQDSRHFLTNANKWFFL